MAYRLFGAKPSSKKMLVYCQLGHKEQISVKFSSTFFPIHENASESIVCELERRPFCPEREELKFIHALKGPGGVSKTLMSS